MANEQADNKQPNQPVKKTSNKKVIIIIAVVAGVLVLMSAIGGWLVWRAVSNKAAETLVEKTLETTTGGKVDVNTNGDVSVKTQDGSVSYDSDKKVSEDFPKTVPQYPSQTIKGNFRTSSQGETTWTVTSISKDDVSTVSNFFKEKLAGWENFGSYQYNDTSTFTGQQGSIKLGVTVGPETDEAGYKTRILYSVTKTQ